MYIENPTQFQLDLKSSNSFMEFRMKNDIGGLYDVPEKEIIKQLIYEYFRTDDYCRLKDFDRHKERSKILKWLEEYDEHPEYIINNDAANFIFEMLSGSILSVNHQNEMLMEYVRMLNRKDNTFFNNLKDSNDNNILMVLAKVFRFDDYNDCLSQVGTVELIKTDIIESFLDSNRLIYEFVKFLLNDCKIDPNIKNKNNVCFKDYISEEYYKKLIEK